MSAVPQSEHISVEDYLAGELVSEIKHEYVAGEVYARAGARNVHNRIAGNVFAFLHARSRGKPCRPYNSDTKVRIRLPTHQRFYYPDAMIVCQPNPADDSFQDAPAVVVEVLSRRTRRIDEREKLEAYTSIPSLSAYLLVDQESAAVVVHRRTAEGFVREAYSGLDAVIPLHEVDLELSLAEIYEDIEFTPEPDDED